MGKHVYELQQLTLHNKARIGYAEGCKPGTSKQLLSSGWALKQTKKSKRFSKNKTKQTNKNRKNKQTNKQTNKQKDYLQKKFQVGMECGKSVNRVKLSKTCKEQKVIVESSYGLNESGEEYLQAAEEESALDNQHCPSKSISPSIYSV